MPKELAPFERYGDHEERIWKPLKGRQLRFIDEYLIDLDATQAARRAGYRACYEAGKNLEQDWRVKQIVKERMEARAMRCQVSADRVLKELEFAAFFDPIGVVQVKIQRERPGKDGGVETYTDTCIRCAEDMEHLSPEIRRCITGWKYDRAGNFLLTFRDKDKALELIGKHLGMFVEKTETTVITKTISGEIPTEDEWATDYVTQH